MTDTETTDDRTLFAFENVALNGFFEGPNREIDWHNVDEKFDDFAADQLDEIGCLLFGRVTYDGMASYWPNALADDPVVAKRMNAIPKVVFSTTLETADWNNTRLVRENAVAEVSALKREPGDDLAIFGSSDLTASLLDAGLVDELRIMVNPVLLGAGKPLFAGLAENVELDLLETRTFESDNVLLTYRPTYEDEER